MPESEWEIQARSQTIGAIEAVHTAARVVLHFTSLQVALKVKASELDEKLRLDKYRRFQTLQALALAFVLVAILVVDYVLLFPVIDFFLNFAFGQNLGAASILARWIIPPGFVAIELSMAHLRAQSSGVHKALWLIAGLLFGLVVPMALLATYLSTLSGGRSPIVLGALVAYPLGYFLFTVAAVCHYTVIIGGDVILTAGDVLATRLADRRVKNRIRNAESEEEAGRNQTKAAYDRFRELVQRYYDSSDFGSRTNQNSPLDQDAVDVLAPSRPGDLDYLQHKGPLFT